MSGFWIALAIVIVALVALRTADCALNVPGACERVAARYATEPRP